MLIYLITNTINNKVYVGQTTHTLKERMWNYKKEYNYPLSKDRPILRAMRKYGFENFSFSILEDDIQIQEELDEKERYYINKYHSLTIQNGYNVELGGNGRGKHSEEVKKKISEAQKGEKNHMFGKTGKLNGASKAIIDLTTGKIYESANLAAKELNLNFSHICATARGSTGNRIFRYLDDENQIIIPEPRVAVKAKASLNAVLDQYKWAI